MSKVCKYGCGVELGQYNTSENKFLETDNKTLHTRDRCESLKQQKVVNDWANKKQDTNGHNDLSLELVLRKLESIGITLDLTKLRNVTNGDKK
jgi:hypothetical protein